MVVLLAGTITAAFTSGFDFLYPVRILAAGAVLWWCRWEYRGLGWTVSWEAVGMGLLVFGIWLGLEEVVAVASESTVESGLETLPTASRLAWLCARILGSVIVIPFAEELAFRAYLTRRLMRAEVGSVAPGTFSWFSFLVSSALFGALHGRWLAGCIAGMAYAIVLYRRKSIGDCVLAHGVTNFLIALYVLICGTWSLW